MNKTQKAIHFSGLNGLRAIAALGVVISHITLALGHFHLDPHILGLLSDGAPIGYQLGNFGVIIFFVLSGFLITYLLQAEQDIKPIDIPKFYIRRILRIWPLYYLYLLLALLTLLISHISFGTWTIPFYIFYTANIPFIVNSGVYLIAHYWSLANEEQFYLFWPWVNRLSQRFLLPVIIVAIGLLISARIACHFFFPGSLIEAITGLTFFHSMMIGAAAAILYRRQHRLFLMLTDHKLSQIMAWLVIFLLGINRFHIISIIDSEIVALVAVVLIIGQIGVRHRLINLDTRLMDFLGRISYGLYVIHPLIIHCYAIIIDPLQISTTARYILVYTLITATTILVSYLSYEYFEKYFLNFKKKFVIVQSSDVKTDI